MEPFHPFRSLEAQQAYLSFYDEQARQWPVPSQTQLVKTSFGETFVRVQGPVDGQPLILLPGDTENSLSWIPVIESLSKTHRTFAIDHIYDNGRSIYSRPITGPDDFVTWLDELLSEIGLKQINLLGYSYGGWQAALFALAHPERLQKLVLLAPSATVLPPGMGLLARAFVYFFLPTAFITKRYFYWYGPDAIREDRTRNRLDEMIEEDLLARRCFKRRCFVAPTVLSDNDWQKLQTPTLFLVGENELTYSAEQAVQRLRAIAPSVETKIASDTDHYMVLVSPTWVVNNVQCFLNAT